MFKSIKHLSIIASACGLVACSTFNTDGYSPSRAQPNNGMQIYPEGYENMGAYSNYRVQEQPVSVPDSYHVGALRKPATHKSVDSQWVSSQSAGSYTIEVADSDKASAVANTLLKAPTTERKAEIKVQQGDKTAYKGVYGTYPSMEAAQEAMQKLPEDVKSNAKITSWGSVQGMVRD